VLNLTKRIEREYENLCKRCCHSIWNLTKRIERYICRYSRKVPILPESHKENWKCFVMHATGLPCQWISQRELKVREGVWMTHEESRISQRELKADALLLDVLQNYRMNLTKRIERGKDTTLGFKTRSAESHKENWKAIAPTAITATARGESHKENWKSQRDFSFYGESPERISQRELKGGPWIYKPDPHRRISQRELKVTRLSHASMTMLTNLTKRIESQEIKALSYF